MSARGTVTFSIAVSNAGPVDAEEVVVTDPLPADAQLVAAEPAQGTCSGNTSRIAFSSNRAGNDEIHVMNPDGTDPKRLTSNAVTDVFPTWSPDGRQIAFQRNNGVNREVYVMKANGKAQTNLTNNPALDQGAVWRP